MEPIGLPERLSLVEYQVETAIGENPEGAGLARELGYHGTLDVRTDSHFPRYVFALEGVKRHMVFDYASDDPRLLLEERGPEQVFEEVYAELGDAHPDERDMFGKARDQAFEFGDLGLFMASGTRLIALAGEHGDREAGMAELLEANFAPHNTVLAAGSVLNNSSERANPDIQMEFEYVKRRIIAGEDIVDDVCAVLGLAQLAGVPREAIDWGRGRTNTL